jgi:hypothetical protein
MNKSNLKSYAPLARQSHHCASTQPGRVHASGL